MTEKKAKPSEDIGGEIKRIDRTSVLQICSAQVVVDLKSAVKELVENSLDVNCKHIEVRFFSHGLNGFEVSDDGPGIKEDDFDVIAKRGTTSKISEFNDIYSIKTMGFRGEALSSLCNIAKVVIQTRRPDEELGWIVRFDHLGNVTDKTQTARKPGTQVSVRELFKDLPVRLIEFKKNCKTQYAKCIQLLQQYALISDSTRLTLMNQSGEGAPFQTVCRTNPSQPGPRGFQENIQCIIGKQKFGNLAPFYADLPKVKVEGYLTKTILSGSVTAAKGTKEQNFCFLNRRPIDLPQKFKRLFNEFYRQYNASMTPIIILSLLIESDNYDINASPDKREVFIKNEREILPLLSAKLEDFFEKISRVQGYNSTSIPISDQKTEPQAKEEKDEVEEESKEQDSRKRPLAQISNLEPSDKQDDQCDKLAKIDNMLDKFKQKVYSKESPQKQRATFENMFKDKKEEAQSQGSDDGLVMKCYEPSKNVAGEQKVHVEDDGLKITEYGAPSSKPAVDASSEESEEINKPKSFMGSSFLPKTGHRLDSVKMTEYSGGGVKVHTFEKKIQPAVSKLKQESSSSSALEKSSKTSPLGQEYAVVSERELKNKQSEFLDQFQKVEDTLNLQRGEADGLTKATMLIQKNASGEGGNKIDKILRDYHMKMERQNARILSNNNKIEVNSELRHFENDKKKQVQVSVDIDENPDVEDDDIQVKALAKLNAEAEEIIPQKKNEQKETISVITSFGKLVNRVHCHDGEIIELERPQPDEEDDDDASGDGVMSYAEEVKIDLSKASDWMSLLRTKGDSKMQQEETIEDLEQFEEKLQQEALDNIQMAGDKLLSIFSKEEFKMMEVIGQFNKGFILTMLEKQIGEGKVERDLFILDQHAADEKYNFEMLSRTTKMVPQDLVKPIKLELSVTDGLIVRQHMDVFKLNGFKLQQVDSEEVKEIDAIDEQVVSNHSSEFLLTSLPTSKKTTFTVDDFYELVHVISENLDRDCSEHKELFKDQFIHKEVLRPSKIYKMLASRACRSSIMVGRSLDEKLMTKVLKNLSSMQSPWNCPHGRPTFRFLRRLDIQGVNRNAGSIQRQKLPSLIKSYIDLA